MQKLVEDFLTQFPGYLKKGPAKVALKLGIEPHYENLVYIKNIMRRIKKEQPKQNIIKEEKSLSKEYLTELAVKTFMENGDYDKAIDFINKLKKEQESPIYKKQNYKEGNYIVLGCLHFPFVNKEFFQSVLNLIEDCPDLQGIILAGDILDMSSISRHNKGLMPVLGYDLAREYRETNEFLDKLDNAIGNRNITKDYFYGNHEDWYNQLFKDINNAKLGIAGPLSPYEACFKHRGYTVQTNWKNAKIKLGDLEIIHGEWTSIHAAHKHLTSLKRNVLFFHTHRLNTFTEENLEGYNCGWGGDKNASVFNYMSSYQKETWRNGLAVVNLNKNNITHTTVIPYKNGLFFNNKLY